MTHVHQLVSFSYSHTPLLISVRSDERWSVSVGTKCQKMVFMFTCKMVSVYTVDWEIFAAKNFLPVV